MTTITKERIEQYAYDDRMCNVNDEIRTMARMLLASMDSAQEPVAWTDEQELRDVEKDGLGYLFTVNPVTPHADPRRVIKLYAAPQPLDDTERAELQESRRILAGLPQMAIDCGWTAAGASAHARCLEDELAAKDAELQEYRKAASEAVAWLWSHRKHKSEVTLTRPEDDERAEAALWSGWTCQPLAPVRPAPVVPDDFDASRLAFEYWATENYDSRLIRSGTGYSGKVLNRMWLCWLACRAAMLQGAVGNSPVIPDGWVACSEQMPDVGDIVLTAINGCTNVGEMERSGANYRYFASVISGRELPATHWMPLPAAPQQEVK